MIEPHVRRFLEGVPVGVVATLRRDGLARQTTVYHLLDGDTVWLSTEATRAKALDVQRTGWASLCVVGPAAPFPSVTVEGPASIQETCVASMTARILAHITGGAVPELTEHNLAASGRVLLCIDIERVYGAAHLPTAAASL